MAVSRTGAEDGTDLTRPVLGAPVAENLSLRAEVDHTLSIIDEAVGTEGLIYPA